MARETLVENVEYYRDISEIQNQSVCAKYGNRLGEIVVEVNVESIMAQLDEDELVPGTYIVKVPLKPKDANKNTWGTLKMPAGAIITEAFIDVNVAKSGPGSLKVFAGATELFAISNTGVSENTAVRLSKFDGTEEITVQVDADYVDEGCASVIIKYILGTV
jgi:hypothetical protein